MTRESALNNHQVKLTVNKELHCSQLLEISTREIQLVSSEMSWMEEILTYKFAVDLNDKRRV